MKGSLIKQHRKFKNLTLEDLASGICSVSYLSKIEHDIISASDDIYRLLGERLNIKLTDINEEFDEQIHNALLEWNYAAQMRDFPLMDELYEKCKTSLEDNQNIELVNLYQIIEVRHIMTKERKPIDEKKLKEIRTTYEGATNEYKFFFHKIVGVHHLFLGELPQALHHFNDTEKLMKKLPIDDGEVYMHLALTYSKSRAYVESTHYAFRALDLYKSTLHYSRMVDSYIIIAINYNSLGALQIAEEYLLKVLRIAKYHLPIHETRRIYHNLGSNYINQEKYDQAYHYLQKAYDIETEETPFKAATIYMLALASFHNREKQLCEEYIHQGEKIAEENNYLKYKHKFYILKYMLNEKTLNEEFIKKLEDIIIPDFRRLNEYKDYKEFTEMLGNLFYEKRMYKKAAMYYKESNNYRDTQKKDLL
ncbi:transcriptional regulator [Halobacillus litoralis]|uniref:Transcriptional regulator n=1 Tax=Halobacillus litoralis TaxID=45668 RepID=A0A845E684_9BACI|nr:tetratricopeptide repeat protein [Halobacillus litoralis]MYL49676.1 transcriptional regulator [Halobacillus litoralis]